MFEGIINSLIGFLTYIFYFVLFAVLIFSVGLLVIRSKQQKKLNDAQQEVLREGKVLVDCNNLRNLYLSNVGDKLTNVGEIKSCVNIVDYDKNNKVVVAVKKGFLNPYVFYKFDKSLIKDLNNKGEPFNDIVLKEWNFVKDKKDFTLITNKNEEIKLKRVDDKSKIGVDTIKNISPTINSAIQVNAGHTIRMRENKLLKLPEDLSKIGGQ